MLACPIVGVRDKNVIYPPSFPQQVDRTLAHMNIPKSLLDEINSAGSFESADFELDGVRTVDHDGSHSKTPEPIRKEFELRQYGTATLGLKWRKVAVSEQEENNQKLEAKLLEKQLRMTKRAHDAFGKDPGFIISDEDRTKRIAALRLRQQLSADASERNAAMLCLQATVRRRLLLPLYPWYHVARLASSVHPTHVGLRKKVKSNHVENSKASNRSEHISDFPAVPNIPWCMCWISLDSMHELDEKSSLSLQQLVTDFKAQEYETCLRRVDNLIYVNSLKPQQNVVRHAQDEKVLIELAALCNRFALRLFHLGRVQIAHAFFSRVLSFTHMSSAGEFPGKHEFFAWTCDLVSLCLWKQGKYEKAHFSLTRSAQHSVPLNAGLVSRLHSCQLLLKLHKLDLVIKLGSKLLVDLLQARYEHNISTFKGRSRVEDTQILRIVEYDEERGSQASAPSFLNLTCHAGLTLAMALHKKARDSLKLERIETFDSRGVRGERQIIVDCEGEGSYLHKKAQTIAHIVLRHMETAPANVSDDLKACAHQYSILLHQETNRFEEAESRTSFRKTALLSYWLGQLRQQKALASGRTRFPPATRQGTNARSLHTRNSTGSGLKGSDASSRQHRSDTPIQPFGIESRLENISLHASVASAGCTFEPGQDWSWASEFYGDVYWQRAHSGFESSLLPRTGGNDF